MARARLIAAGTTLLVLAAVPLAGAKPNDRVSANAAAVAAGDPIRAEVRNGTTAKETEIIGQFDATTGSKGGYVTRQSNTQTGAKAGGGAIYGCRGAAGGTAAGSAPCLRASNLAAGFAFEFAGEGDVVGQISVGDGKTANAKAKPFTTNATGVATGLNADQVDGKSATDFAPATAMTFAIVSDSGATPPAPTVTGPAATAATPPTVTFAASAANDGVYTIDFKRDVSKCSYTASVAGSSAARAPGVAAVSGQVNQVAVNLGSAAGAAPADPRVPNRGSFHVQVIC